MRVKFVKEDLWIGLYYKRELLPDAENFICKTTYYLCLLPCLPIIWERVVPIPAIVIQGAAYPANPSTTKTI